MKGKKYLSSLGVNNIETITMTSDVMFKTIIKMDMDYTRELVSNILESSKDDFLNMTFTDNELEINSKDDKGQKADLIIRNNNQYINIEMNKNKFNYVPFRNLTYLYRIAFSSIKRGKSYDDKKTYYQINFNNFNCGDKLINKFCYKEVELGHILIENFIVYNISLDKLNDIKYTESVNKKLVQYLKIMTCNNITELNELAGDDKILKGVVKMLEEKSQDEKLIGAYDKEEEDEMIRQSIRAEGEAKGEAKNRLEIAKNLLEQKFDFNMISKTTGLSLNEIKRITM